MQFGAAVKFKRRAAHRSGVESPPLGENILMPLKSTQLKLRLPQQEAGAQSGEVSAF